MTTEPLVGPGVLGGAVHSRRTSEDLPPELEATVSAVRIVPRGDAVVDWDVGLRAPAGQEHHLYVFAPSALPVPVRSGDAVRVRTRRTGGGPNLRYAIEVRAAGGPLLLAVNALPSDWAVTRGTAAGKTPMAGYDQEDYGVVFEHAGQRLEPAHASWAVLTAGPRSYYLWGHAAERTLHPGKAPMPDYVGGWLDFAIVMAR
ncbi:MAG: hypothetical protein HY908_28150 [Myxococcales bacterium]|nr:hypothetical protein [Myxococcales bacterium]